MATPLLIDPGENVWPSSWFGNLSTIPFAEVRPAPWRSAHGDATLGFDFGLPPFVTPSPSGLLTLARSWYLPSTPQPLPALGFNATAVFHMWVSWRQLEPSEGEYDFTALLANLDAAAAAGWRVGVRLLTARIVEYAPGYLATRGARVLPDGLNYDPSDPIFHARYLAMLDQLRGLRLCQRPALALMYVGYASKSYGDEFLGPCGYQCTSDPADQYEHVRARLDAWAAVCESCTHKVIMGGESAYGTRLGFGTRNGFVEHYADRGQLRTESDIYLRVNETAVLLRDGLILGEENEEYAANWASEWRTSQPGARGGPFNATAPPQGGIARYGPLASFNYRYLMSSMRLLQMRVTALLASPVVVHPELFAYVPLALGRSHDDAPDAWAFLASTVLWDGRRVSNLERWLSQRAEPVGPGLGSGIVTHPDAKMTQTPAPPSNRTWMTDAKHDWIAQHAPGGAIGFSIDRRWARAAGAPLGSTAVVKVTLFDVLAGSIDLTTDHRLPATNGTSRSLCTAPLPTLGDGQLKTLTLRADGLLAAGGGTEVFDFVVRATSPSGAPQSLVLSMVRVVKLGRGTGGEGGEGNALPEDGGGALFGDGVDARGVVVCLVLAGLLATCLCVLFLREKRTRFGLGGGTSRARTGATMAKVVGTPGAASPSAAVDVRAVELRAEGAPAWPPQLSAK